MNSHQPMLLGSQELAPQHEGFFFSQPHNSPHPEVPALLRASKGTRQAPYTDQL